MIAFKVAEDGVLFRRSAEGTGGEGEAAHLLEEWLDNGLAVSVPQGVKVPHEVVADLDREEGQIVGLPDPYPFEIALFPNEAIIPDPSFRYRLEFLPHPLAPPFAVARVGCFITIDGAVTYRLTPPQFRLCEAVAAFDALPEGARTIECHWSRFAEIRALARAGEVYLDPYLANEEVVLPERIRLKIERQGEGTITLHPEIEGIDQPQFEKRFRSPRIRKVYSLESPEGKRRRIVFSPAQQRELEKIKKYRRLEGEMRERLLEAPQEIFDPDLIDLDDFSERVVRIGLYKPRVYPFVSPYKSQWIPGSIVETSPTQRLRIPFPTREAVERFAAAYEEARAKGARAMRWEGEEIPLQAAGSALRHARRQWEQPDRPINQGEGGEPVLIIKENIETLEHAEAQPRAPLAPDRFEHRYQAIPGLKGGVEILPHQREGIAWLQSLHLDGYRGALLADDMGLGKTLQILAFLSWHRAKRNVEGKPYLLVAPVSLLESWEEEYGKFWAQRMPVVREYGGAHNLDDVGKGDAGIVLTTYETLRRRQFEFCRIAWSVVVLDEAQKIKTPGTLVTNAVKALKADFKIAATGTPVENTLVDLWSICDFIVPGLLGSARSFAQSYQTPLKKEETDLEQLGERLRAQIGCHIKRRLKEDVLEALPPKRIVCRKRRMPPEQEARYLAALRGGVEERAPGRNAMLRCLFEIRDISDHPALPDREIDAIPIDRLLATSAKLAETHRCLEEIRERGEKVILFSDRRKTQRLLARLLRECFGVNPSIIHGQTPVHATRSKESRREAVERFQAQPGFHAIVISPLAAGVGLNITAANHVIHYTRSWNPAREEQATDRVYRIGQRRTVYVHLPMAVSDDFKSFDLVIHELLERKRALARASLFPTEQAEISPLELFEHLHEHLPGSSHPLAAESPLGIEDLDTLEPFCFEAAVAALWDAAGYAVILTPRRGDHGADVVARRGERGFLLQVKSGRSSLGPHSVIGEILRAKSFYGERFGCDFSLGIVTNRPLTPQAEAESAINGIEIYGRDWLAEQITRHPLTLSQIHAWEARREQ